MNRQRTTNLLLVILTLTIIYFGIQVKNLAIAIIMTSSQTTYPDNSIPQPTQSSDNQMIVLEKIWSEQYPIANGDTLFILYNLRATMFLLKNHCDPTTNKQSNQIQQLLYIK